MQKAIQLPSPTVSPRHTPPPPSTSASVPIPVSKSPQKQHVQQQTISITNSSATTYASVSMSPPKKKGPPSPLTFGGQSPPSFSSVAAGNSPKLASPLLKLQQVPKGQGASTVPGGLPANVTSLPTAQPAANTMLVSGGGIIRGQSTSRPGKLADITGPADAYCLLYTSPSPRDATLSRMPSSA